MSKFIYFIKSIIRKYSSFPSGRFLQCASNIFLG